MDVVSVAWSPEEYENYLIIYYNIMRNKTIKRTKPTKSKHSNRKSQRKSYGGSSPLYNAAKNGDIEKVKEILKNDDVPINKMSEDLFHNVGMSRFTPIQVAARYGHCNVVRYLHEEKGVSLYENDDVTGESLLILAVKSGNINTVKYLLDNGMDINYPSQNALKNTPLFYVKNNHDMMILLISRGADLDIKNHFDKFAPGTEPYRKKRDAVKKIPGASAIQKMPVPEDVKRSILYKHLG